MKHTACGKLNLSLFRQWSYDDEPWVGMGHPILGQCDDCRKMG